MSGKNDKGIPLATTPAETTKPEIQPFKNKGLRGRKRPISRTSSGIIITTPLTQRRRRSERQAKSVLINAGLDGRHLIEAMRHLRSEKQPIRRARQIAERTMTNRKGIKVPVNAKLDLSDVQELKAKLIKRDFGIWSPHSDYLRRILEDILSGNITKAEFERRSAVLLDMAQPLSEDFRKAEWKLARTGEWK